MSYVDFKVVLLGRENGGKTSLVYRYLHGKFAGDMPYQGTIGAAFAARRVECKGRILTMGIWDTAGGEKYKSMSNLYYRNAKAAIICYDLTSPYSFERAQDWVHELREHEVECKVYMVGTKLDLIKEDRQTRHVHPREVTKFCDEINVRYCVTRSGDRIPTTQIFETSSRTGENVEKVFQKIVEDFVSLHPEATTPTPEPLSNPAASLDGGRMRIKLTETSVNPLRCCGT